VTTDLLIPGGVGLFWVRNVLRAGSGPSGVERVPGDAERTFLEGLEESRGGSGARRENGGSLSTGGGKEKRKLRVKWFREVVEGEPPGRGVVTSRKFILQGEVRMYISWTGEEERGNEKRVGGGGGGSKSIWSVVVWGGSSLDP